MNTNNKTCKQCDKIKDKDGFSGRSLTCKYCTNQNSIKKKEEKAILEGNIYIHKPRIEYDANKTHKTCTKCSGEKELSEYYINNKAKDGYTARCIKCQCRKRKISDEDLISKICNTCKIRKELFEFSKGDCRLGCKNKCKECDSISKKIYRDNRLISYDEKLRLKEYQERYYINNKDKFKSYGELYRENNKEIILNRNKNYNRKRRKSDIIFKVRENIRTSIGNSFRISGYTKKSRTHEILGCSFEEFKLHLESKFENWMSWDNKGLYNGDLDYGWDIDHIIPISSAKTEEDIVRLNHFSNFQPLCSHINRNIKRDKIDYK
jgi:hypothetical protein